MFSYLKRFFVDPEYFASAVGAVNWSWLLRFALGAFGVLATHGVLVGSSDGAWWTGVGTLISAFGIKVGDKNDPAQAQRLAEVEARLAALAPADK